MGKGLFSHNNAKKKKKTIFTQAAMSFCITQVSDKGPWPSCSLFPLLKKMLVSKYYASRGALGCAIFQCLNSILRGDYFAAFMS